MSAETPVRASRRAATRRKVVVESSDEEEETKASIIEDEEFTPAPQSSPRKQARRKTTDVPATPRTSGRTRRTTVEPSQILSPPDSVASEAKSPPKKLGRPRQSIRAGR